MHVPVVSKICKDYGNVCFHKYVKQMPGCIRQAHKRAISSEASSWDEYSSTTTQMELKVMPRLSKLQINTSLKNVPAMAINFNVTGAVSCRKQKVLVSWRYWVMYGDIVRCILHCFFHPKG